MSEKVLFLMIALGSVAVAAPQANSANEKTAKPTIEHKKKRPGPPPKATPPVEHTIGFRPSTLRGQVLEAGATAPATTLEEAESLR